MFHGWTPSCSLKEVFDKKSKEIEDFVESCNVITRHNRRVKIMLKTDENNKEVEKVYKLSIGYIPVYCYEQKTINGPVVW